MIPGDNLTYPLTPAGLLELRRQVLEAAEAASLQRRPRPAGWSEQDIDDACEDALNLNLIYELGRLTRELQAVVRLLEHEPEPLDVHAAIEERFWAWQRAMGYGRGDYVSG